MIASSAPPASVAVPESPTGAAKLRANELNLFDETVVAISSVGPTYSLAATMGLLFVAVAYAGPAAIMVSFLPMLFIAVAYFYLNRRDPNCGASYAWLSKLVGPRVGWFNGWVQLAASILFCIAAPVLAADYTLQFIHSIGWTSHTLSNAWLIAGIAVAWLASITLITIYSVRWTANFQWVFLIIQYGVVVVTSIWGIVKVAVHHPAGSTGFHWSWLNPLSLHGYQGLAAGVVLGLFLFWGWDTAVNLNEESKNASKTPGRTQLLNFFQLFQRAADGTPAPFAYAVDLPGYGFAKVDASKRASWDELAGGYLATRRCLVGVVLVMDARRPLVPADEALLAWLVQRPQPTPLRVHLLLNKSDQLNRAERAAALRLVQQRIATLPLEATAQMFSARTRDGLEELQATLDDVLAQARIG